MRVWYRVRYGLLALSVLAGVTACSGTPAQSGVKATLEPGPMAPLGGVIPFHVTVTYPKDAPGPDGPQSAIVQIGLASGLSLVDQGWARKDLESGYVQYSRPITFQANVPQTFDFQVRLDQLGEHEVGVGAVISNGGGDQDGHTIIKILDVGADSTTIHDLPLAYPTKIPGPQRDDELREAPMIEAPAPTQQLAPEQ